MGALSPFPAPAAPPAPSPGRQRPTEGVPLGFDRRDTGAHSDFVCPVVRIQTPGPLGQLVPFLGAPGPPRNTLDELRIPGSQSCGFGASQHLAQNRLIIDDDLGSRRGLTLFGGRLRTAGRLRITPRSRGGLAGQRGVATKHLPVERQIRMRVLERHASFVVERPPPDRRHVCWRSKEVQHATSARSLSGAIPVNDVGRFVSALVARVPDERHGRLPLALRRGLGPWGRLSLGRLRRWP